MKVDEFNKSMASAAMLGRNHFFTQLHTFSPINRSCELHIENLSNCPMSTLLYVIFGDRPKNHRVDFEHEQKDTLKFEKKCFPYKGVLDSRHFV